MASRIEKTIDEKGREKILKILAPNTRQELELRDIIKILKAKGLISDADIEGW